jgi:hypothetical protein
MPEKCSCLRCITAFTPPPRTSLAIRCTAALQSYYGPEQFKAQAMSMRHLLALRFGRLWGQRSPRGCSETIFSATETDIEILKPPLLKAGGTLVQRG